MPIFLSFSVLHRISGTLEQHRLYRSVYAGFGVFQFSCSSFSLTGTNGQLERSSFLEHETGTDSGT